MTVLTLRDIDRQTDAECARYRSDAAERHARHRAEDAAADDAHRIVLAALATARAMVERDDPADLDPASWVSTSDLARLWQVNKDTAYRRLTRSKLVAQPIPSRTIGNEKQVPRAHIAPILSAWSPSSDMAKSEGRQRQA